MRALIDPRHQRRRQRVAAMGEHHVPALGALGLDHRGKTGEAAAALAVGHQRFAHLIDVVGQDQGDLGALRPCQPGRHDDRGGKAKRDGTAAESGHVPRLGSSKRAVALARITGARLCSAK